MLLKHENFLEDIAFYLVKRKRNYKKQNTVIWGGYWVCHPNKPNEFFIDYDKFEVKKCDLPKWKII
jgi:hypothetical protein